MMNRFTIEYMGKPADLREIKKWVDDQISKGYSQAELETDYAYGDLDCIHIIPIHEKP